MVTKAEHVFGRMLRVIHIWQKLSYITTFRESQCKIMAEPLKCWPSWFLYALYSKFHTHKSCDTFIIESVLPLYNFMYWNKHFKSNSLFSYFLLTLIHEAVFVLSLWVSEAIPHVFNSILLQFISMKSVCIFVSPQMILKIFAIINYVF
jgi:hypothetical protein